MPAKSRQTHKPHSLFAATTDTPLYVGQKYIMPYHPLIFSSIALAMLFSGCGRQGDGREGGSDKREWSILQNLTSQYKGEVINHPEIRQVAEYQIICVPHHSDRTRIWIMAAPKSPPFYKQMPRGNYWLTKEQIEDIRKQANPITTVLEALESHTK